MTPMTLLNSLRRKRPAPPAPKRKLFLNSEHAPCTCPEPCERDHGNE
jgi:hypothetical protein